MSPAWLALLALIVALALAFAGAPLWAFLSAAAIVLFVAEAPWWTFVLLVLAGAVLLVKAIRLRLLTRPILSIVRRLGVVPAISDTERVALEAGTVGFDGELFSGRPSWERAAAIPWPTLAQHEREFLDGPVARACEMADEWSIRGRQDLPPELWSFLRRERFFSMIIPPEHGGLGFSPRAQAAVVTRLASRSIPLAVTVMVPNSLGPAELLLHYGTPEQRARWLPRLAAGEEIPCFALTEPEAGSDAGGITSSGVVEAGPDGRPRLRLEWSKRYITLAPVATLLGVAVRLRDPQELLGRGPEPGITCVLVPASTPGVEIGRRHDPMGAAFLNGPTTGRDVVVPVDAIIGGAAGAGMGWRMLMECLAAGRAVSLPSLSVGTAKRMARVTGAHAAVRRQFGTPIGRFEGVEEPLARIAGRTWLMEAVQAVTCGELHGGAKPSVVSAIAKHAQTEMARGVVTDAMDVVGGAGVVRGPRNLIEAYWTAQPIGITVEGANILTRTLIIFGQGAIRCHPHAWAEAEAIARSDAEALDAVLWRHAGHVVRNAARSLLLSLSRGRLARGGPGGPAAGAWRRVQWGSASFALLADVALGSLGGELKRREKLSGRLADILSNLYLASCAIRRFEAEGRRQEDVPFLRWSVDHCLAAADAAFSGALREIPVPVLGPLLRVTAAPWSRLNPLALPPSDALGHELARALQEPGPRRERLLAGAHLPADPADPLSKLEEALLATSRADAVTARIRAAMRRGEMERRAPEDALDEACRRSLVTEDEAALVRRAAELRREAVQVDAS